MLQKSLSQYRVPFYESVREGLRDAGIEFRVVYGRPTGADSLKADSRDLPWGVFVRNRQVGLGSRRLLWQPALRQLRRGDLVVVEQASKLLINYLLLVGQALGLIRVAFWGHGRTVLGSRVSEVVKRWVSTRPAHWFAYTNGTQQIVESIGYTTDRITVLDNAIDTRRLMLEADRIRKARVGGRGSRCVFVGSLYAGKGLAYLLEAASSIQRQIPDFELVIVGDGPDRAIVVNAAEGSNWIHYEGPRFDADLVPFLVGANLLLVPGAVGLVVLDSFATQCPLVTIEGDGHGPEIEYIEDGVNGRRLARNAPTETYAAAVVSILKDKATLDRLRAGCRAGAERYTLENMVGRFVAGCVHALGL